MNQLKLSVRGNNLTVTQDAVTTQGCINYDKCTFTFDDEWNSCTKTAVFSTVNDDSYRVALNNNTCTIPHVCTEKEGIIRIAVLGISDDDTVIATNFVAHKISEGIGDSYEWFEEEFNFAEREIKKFREEIRAIKGKVDSFTFDAGKPQVDDGDWYIPNEVTDAADCPIVSKGSTYDDFLNFRLNSLVRNYPEYITRHEIGRDFSSNLPVYAYTFEPENYSKTVFISSYVHGTDRIAFLALSYFLENLCNQASGPMSYIRNNIKLQVVPVVNPYGLVNGKVYNQNNVNLNRNFPFNWSSCSNANKGNSAADQTETQNIMSFLEEIADDKLCAVIDVHASSSVIAGRTLYYPKFRKNSLDVLTEVVNTLNRDELPSDKTSTAVLAATSNPTLCNYAADRFGVDACQLVWNNSIYGGIYSNFTMTKYVEFIGNTVYAMAKNSKFTKKQKPQPFTKHIAWHSGSAGNSYTVTSTSRLTAMGISACSLKLDMPCILTANGYVTLNVSTGCTVKINPVLYQVNSSEQDYTDRLNSPVFCHEIYLSPGTHVIPISTVLQAFYSSYNDTDETMFCEDVYFVLAFSASVASAVRVSDFSVTVNAINTDIARPVEISTPMGNASDYGERDIPTQSLLYPIEQVTEQDNYSYD